MLCIDLCRWLVSFRIALFSFILQVHFHFKVLRLFPSPWRMAQHYSRRELDTSKPILCCQFRLHGATTAVESWYSVFSISVNLGKNIFERGCGKNGCQVRALFSKDFLSINLHTGTSEKLSTSRPLRQSFRKRLEDNSATSGLSTRPPKMRKS